MAAKSISIADAKSAKIQVIEQAGVGSQAVHDVVVAMQANRRTGSANTKTRGEVAATGKKPFRQKGTGRARQGGNANPIHRGGGVVFGPRPRDYSKKVPKSVKKLAFSRALTDRIAGGDVYTTGEFAIADGKTKSFVSEIDDLLGKEERIEINTDLAEDERKRKWSKRRRKVLVVAKEFSEETKRAGRNVKPVLLMSAAEVNTEHLLYYDKIVIVDDAMETIAQRTNR